MEGGRGVRTVVWAALRVALAAAVVTLMCGVALAASRTYTTDADFDEGVLVGVEHETVADQLQPSTRPAILPYIWLPNQGDGTVSKVDTRTGNELGRYRVSPHDSSLPSRTTVDQQGNCWVGCRQAGTVVKIGLYEAGQWLDRNGDGICQTSYDMNGDGDITGDELLPWGLDECVLYEVVLVAGYEGTYVPGTYIGPYDYEYWGTAPRGLAIDANNNLWAGTWTSQDTGYAKFFYIDSASGVIEKVVDVSAWGHHSYGATLDGNGVLWSSFTGGHVLWLDPSTDPPSVGTVEIGHGIYGVGIDYLGNLFVTGPADVASLTKIDVDTRTIEWDQQKPELVCCVRGVVATQDNDIWVANTTGNAVYRYDNDGNLKATIGPVGGPCGVAVDAANKIWIGDLNDEYIHRVDPATNTIELSKQIVGSGGHYTYSDMTGIVSWTITTKQGTWTATYDSGVAGSQWGTLSWHSDEPAGSGVFAEARSSENGLDWSGWEGVANAVPLVATPNGRYLQIKATLHAPNPAAAPVLYDLTVSTASTVGRMVSHSPFEEARSPWAAFAAGQANTWRRALTTDPLAHSGAYAMSAEVSGEGFTGLVMPLPAEPIGIAEVTLRAWAYVDARTVGDASTFFGLSFASGLGPTLDSVLPAVGWNVLSDADSQLQLFDVAQPTAAGVPQGGWHLVQLRYTTSSGRFGVWLDGSSVADVVLPAAAGSSPTYAALGAAGVGPTAQQHVYFDDVTLTLVSVPIPTQTRAFSLLDGAEQVVEGTEVPYELEYGNGYAVLEPGEIPGTLPQSIYVGLSLPAGYSLVEAIPAPARVAGQAVVWELPMPDLGQAGYISLTALTPTGLAAPLTDRMWAWATADPAAAGANPPDPPGISLPPDLVWGAPQDMLAQQVDLGPRPDLWVYKSGPTYAAPGDTITYSVTVGNSGTGAATDITVRDIMPDLLGDGDNIVGNIGELAPGETWTAGEPPSGELPWGVPGGTLVLNEAYVPTAPMEVVVDNNISTWITTVQSAQDPNRVVNSPRGVVDRNQLVSYLLLCKNEGAGNAYGVYATCALSSQLDASTLRITNPAVLRYDPATRTLVWEVGKLAPGQEAKASFTVRVAPGAKRARAIPEQGVVYFPSVPETTDTNVVFNVVRGTFPDVQWPYWATLAVELCCENGIVTGYGDGTYRPGVEVKRDQMAVFSARAVAGGDAKVPDGPPTPRFSDVDASYWAYKYIEYCVANYIVVGYAVDNTYRPGEKVNRGQMAAYVARAIYSPRGIPPDDLPGYVPPLTPSFPDVATDHPFYKHVEYVVGAGVVQGFGDGTYRTGELVKRDQMAVYVRRAFALPE